MAMILALLAAMGGVGVLLWRIQATSHAAKGAFEAADEARGFSAASPGARVVGS